MAASRTWASAASGSPAPAGRRPAWTPSTSTRTAFGLDDALLRVGADAAVVLPLLNGIEHMDSLHRRFGESAAAGSIGRLEAYRRGPTEIVQAKARPVVTAAADGLPADELDAAV